MDSAALTFAFLVTILQIIAIIAAVMGVQVALRIYAEEIEYRVEPLLAASLRRSTYLASNAVVALLGPAAAVVVTGTALGLVAHATDGSVAFGDVIWQATVTIPAVWVLVGLAPAAVGAAPAASGSSPGAGSWRPSVSPSSVRRSSCPTGSSASAHCGTSRTSPPSRPTGPA